MLKAHIQRAQACFANEYVIGAAFSCREPLVFYVHCQQVPRLGVHRARFVTSLPSFSRWTAKNIKQRYVQAYVLTFPLLPRDAAQSAVILIYFGRVFLC